MMHAHLAAPPDARGQVAAAAQRIVDAVQHHLIALADGVESARIVELEGGRIPKLARFCQWMRAKDAAITARRPR